MGDEYEEGEYDAEAMAEAEYVRAEALRDWMENR